MPLTWETVINGRLDIASIAPRSLMYHDDCVIRSSEHDAVSAYNQDSDNLEWSGYKLNGLYFIVWQLRLLLHPSYDAAKLPNRQGLPYRRLAGLRILG